MKNLFLFCIILNLNWIFIFAQPTFSVDISYLVADLKYNQIDGVKICEIQHGALSAINGDLYISGENGTIPTMIADFFARFPIKKWAAGYIYQPLKRSFEEREWDVKQSFNKIIKDLTFLNNASLDPVNPFFITSYYGMVFADFNIVHNFNFYHKTYPGILFVNAATFPYWKDKYKMNALFNKNDELKKYKADWRLYEKKYNSLLSERIQNDMPSQFYVIKPRSEFLANGVIVVENKDLDNVLQMILKPSASLNKHPDKKYSYWLKNKDTSFIVEKYYQSDYLCFSSPLNQEISDQTEYHYDPTMRLAFILQYDGGEMSYHHLGGFWKLPSKALEEKQSLNETTISCCKAPFYNAVDPKTLREVDAHMQRAMLLLYEIMLNERI